LATAGDAPAHGPAASRARLTRSARRLTFFAELAVRGPRRVLAAAALLAVVAAALGRQTPHLLGRGANDFVAQGSESIAAEKTIEAASGLSAPPQLLVLIRSPSRLRLARVASIIRSEPTFPVLAAPLFSRNGSEALVAAYARASLSQRAWRQAARHEQSLLASAAAGHTAHLIADTAEEVRADVIVVGTRGHAPVAGLLLGSVVQRLLHVAHCPVLVVPATDGQAAAA